MQAGLEDKLAIIETVEVPVPVAATAVDDRSPWSRWSLRTYVNKPIWMPNPATTAAT